MTELKRRPLFNFEGSDTLDDRQAINGNPTGIANLNEIKYQFGEDLYHSYERNVWFPTVVSLASDVGDMLKLTPYELDALKETLSFLIYLDSSQCLVLPNISNYITDSSIRDGLSIQNTQEVIHSRSYQYILNALFDFRERESIYYLWKNKSSESLRKRIEWVAKINMAFENDPTLENFKKVLMAIYVLEGIFFYHGFAFFHQLAFRGGVAGKGLLTGVDNIIQYIENDELTHVAFFANLINELLTTDDKKELSYLLREGVDMEIEHNKIIYGDNRIVGISYQSTEDYGKFLCNDRCKLIGIEPLFEEVKNPYIFLKNGSGASVQKRDDFFSKKNTQYDRSTGSSSGLDDLLGFEHE